MRFLKIVNLQTQLPISFDTALVCDKILKVEIPLTHIDTNLYFLISCFIHTIKIEPKVI